MTPAVSLAGRDVTLELGTSSRLSPWIPESSPERGRTSPSHHAAAVRRSAWGSAPVLSSAAPSPMTGHVTPAPAVKVDAARRRHGRWPCGSARASPHHPAFASRSRCARSP